MSFKRSHSEALLEEAGKQLEPKSSFKKRRVGESVGDSAGSVETKEERKARKQARRDRLAKQDIVGGDDIAIDQISTPALAQQTNGDGAVNAIDESAEKRKRKEERKQKKVKTDSPLHSLEVVAASNDAHDNSSTADPESKANGTKKKKNKKSKTNDEQPMDESISHIEDTTCTKVPNGVSNGISTQMAHGYQQKSSLTELSKSEIDNFLSTQFVTITDPKYTGYRPIIEFRHLPTITATQDKLFGKFKAPTPIQAATWPFLFAGRDVVGVAETGSGKTLAFGLPCMQYVSAHAHNSKRGGTVAHAVIVSPTRELALQSHEQLEALTKGTSIEVVCVYGGVPKDSQRAALRSAHIIVATPGRLNDFIQEGGADLSGVGYVVLDEADRMLDKGFEEAIRMIISSTASVRQTAMFTATWPTSIRDLASSFMTDPVKVAIGDNPSGDLRANNRVTQKVEVVDHRGKETRLLQLLKQYQSGKNATDRILVFCLYKKEAMRIEQFIRTKGFRVAGIHGDLPQNKRTEALESFKSGHVPVLVATDVAARGLDIPAVKVVINVTFPLTAEDYVHRIGRTGRAGQDGLAITLFTDHDKALAGALVNVLKAAKQEVPEELMKFGTTVKKKAHEAYGAFYKETGEDSKKATKITFD